MDEDPIAAAAVKAWAEKHGHPAPEWVGRKAVLDSYDDGGGLWRPHDGSETYRDEFLAWARENMGQGYSLAINDGVFIDTVTDYCHRGYVEGRRAAISNRASPAGATARVHGRYAGQDEQCAEHDQS